MKNRVKIISIISFLVSAIVLISGCTSENKVKNGTTIVCTIFPIYDWCCEITKDCEDVNVILLEDNGTDMHSYQPAVKDFANIEDCDVFIFVGGESEEWAVDYINEHPSDARRNICLMDEIADYVLVETDEGIIATEDEESDEEENDEHIWLSLKRSIMCVYIIGDSLKDKTVDSDKIAANTADYVGRLSELDKEYEDYFASNERKIIVADRFPFRYLTEDYSVDYLAALPGCSAEADTSFDMVISLADGYKQSNENTLYITESGNKEFADTVIGESGKDGVVKTLDSVQSVSKDKIQSGVSYYELMKQNLETLKGNN